MVRCRARRIFSSSRSSAALNPGRLGAAYSARSPVLDLEIDERLSLGLVLGREHVQHGLGDDAWRGLRGLLGEQLNSGLRDGDGYGVHLHGNLRPKAGTGLFTFCKQMQLTRPMQNH